MGTTLPLLNNDGILFSAGWVGGGAGSAGLNSCNWFVDEPPPHAFNNSTLKSKPNKLEGFKCQIWSKVVGVVDFMVGFLIRLLLKSKKCL